MAGKRILLARAEVNMIAADDVYTADDQLLIPADTVLTEDVIAALKRKGDQVFAGRAGLSGRTRGRKLL